MRLVLNVFASVEWEPCIEEVAIAPDIDAEIGQAVNDIVAQKATGGRF